MCGQHKQYGHDPGCPVAHYAKWSPADVVPTIADEVVRLRWARHEGRLPVPEVLDAGADWMVTRAVAGTDGSRFAPSDGPALAAATGEAMAGFHRAPKGSCPFDNRLDAMLARIEQRGETQDNT